VPLANTGQRDSFGTVGLHGSGSRYFKILKTWGAPTVGTKCQRATPTERSRLAFYAVGEFLNLADSVPRKFSLLRYLTGILFCSQKPGGSDERRRA